ncbi:MAG: hypothetical protein Q9172_007443 [Xanthocarpia lactea]
MSWSPTYNPTLGVHCPIREYPPGYFIHVEPSETRMVALRHYDTEPRQWTRGPNLNGHETSIPFMNTILVLRQEWQGHPSVFGHVPMRLTTAAKVYIQGFRRIARECRRNSKQVPTGQKLLATPTKVLQPSGSDMNDYRTILGPKSFQKVREIQRL